MRPREILGIEFFHRKCLFSGILKTEVPEVTTVCLDVTSPEIQVLIESYGPFDGLVNNAALAILEPFLEASESNFDKLFEVNVKAPLRVSQVVAKQMIQHNIKGSIVNVSSQASKIALRDHVVYCSTKAALDAMSKVMALELGEHGIRVNCVNPTVVMTKMGKIGWSDPRKADPLLQRIPLHRFAEVDEVVNAILFLLSEESSFINSVSLPIDGGFLSS
uniref:Putative diacetyl reductase/l-xylulose reductase n=1 Tax=Rhodnius prolixus TaxID=13249 RepID=A0A4P6D9J4_RHOPR